MNTVQYSAPSTAFAAIIRWQLRLVGWQLRLWRKISNPIPLSETYSIIDSSIHINLAAVSCLHRSKLTAGVKGAISRTIMARRRGI